MRSAQVFRRHDADIDIGFGHNDTRQLLAQFSQILVAESGADAAGVDEFAVLRFRQQQCTQAAAAALGFGETDNDEFVRRPSFYFHPIAVARADVGTIDALADDAFTLFALHGLIEDVCAIADLTCAENRSRG